MQPGLLLENEPVPSDQSDSSSTSMHTVFVGVSHALSFTVTLKALLIVRIIGI